MLSKSTLSFSLFRLDHELPEDILARLADRAIPSLEKAGEEPKSGFAARHAQETEFTEATCCLADLIHFQFVTIQRKVPAALLALECSKRELAALKVAGEGSGYLSRKRRTEIKEEARKELLGRASPSFSATPVFIDTQAGLLYIGTASDKAADEVAVAILEALQVPILPITVETTVAEALAATGEELKPLVLVEGASEDAERWMGRDFLTWLWFMAEEVGGKFTVPEHGEFAVGIDGPLIFAAEGEGAHEAVVRKGVPTGAPEANSALCAGKKLRSARLMIGQGRGDTARVWHLTFDAATCGFRAVKLPECIEVGTSDFEERADFLYILQAALRALMARFAKEVSGHRRATTEELMRSWALGRGWQGGAQ